jgi:GPI ethanolamine phosphate transferase 1
MSVFTLLPAMKTENLPLILLGGFLMFAMGVLYILFEKSILAQSLASKGQPAPKVVDSLSRVILGVQVGLVLLAMLVTRSSVSSIQSNQGLPLGTQIVGWLVFIASLTVPFLHGLQPQNHYIHRLAVVSLTFAPLFIILTISFEGILYFTFAATLICWVRLENRIYVYTTSSASRNATEKALSTSKTGGTPSQSDAKKSNETSPIAELNPTVPVVGAATTRLTALSQSSYRSITLADARISLFILFFIQSGFFSTGNVASVSSFSLEAVARLVPVFDPFSQGALLMIKLLAPFVLISVNLGLLNRRLGVAPSALFMGVMAISDVMTLNFFWMVRDEGSWLDIGTTISHFCIASGLGVFVSGIELASEIFLSGVQFDEPKPADEKVSNGKVANGETKKAK